MYGCHEKRLKIGKVPCGRREQRASSLCLIFTHHGSLFALDRAENYILKRRQEKTQRLLLASHYATITLTPAEEQKLLKQVNGKCLDKG